MNWKFWKKQEYKRPKYYPKCRINYIKNIELDSVWLKVDSINECCDDFKKTLKIADPSYLYFESDVMFNFSDHNNENPYLYIRQDSTMSMFKVWYCPFCGAKIELTCIKTLKLVKTGCDEIIEPEKVIPAKTKKIPKYDWQEVKS